MFILLTLLSAMCYVGAGYAMHAAMRKDTLPFYARDLVFAIIITQLLVAGITSQLFAHQFKL